MSVPTKPDNNSIVLSMLKMRFEKTMDILKAHPFKGPLVAYLIISSTIGGILWGGMQALELPTVIEFSENIRLPKLVIAILGGLILGAPFLIFLQAAVNSRESRNEILGKIEDVVMSLEKLPVSPFRSFLLNRILYRALRSVISIKNQAEKQDVQKKLINYQTKIRTLLSEADKEVTVLALCGEKGLSKFENTHYFEDFFKFAIANQKYLKGVGGIRVCRIFVQSKVGFTEPMLKALGDHRHHEKYGDMAAYGVIALEVPEESHRGLEKEYKEIIERLDEGLGFVLFHKNRKVVAISHEGLEEKLTFTEYDDSLVFQEFLNIFKNVCIRSNEYKKNKKIEEQLEALFNRLQTRMD